MLCIDFLVRCEIPRCEDENRMFSTPWLNISTPFNSNLPEKCKKYQELSSKNDLPLCSFESFNRSVIEECRDNFIYEDDEITIQNEVSNKLIINNNFTKLSIKLYANIYISLN